MPLFCDIALAERIERAEAQLMAKVCERGFAIELAGGMATYAGDGSPYNKVAGLGFGGVPANGALDEIELAYATVGSPVQIELCHLGDPAIGALLTERGYRLVGFENLLGIALDGARERVAPSGIEIRPSGEDELERWLQVSADATLVPDTDGVPSHEAFSREEVLMAMRAFATADVKRYVAVRNGVVAGEASFYLSGSIAQLTGAATLPAHRRRGIQTALFSTRLLDAAAAGAEIAVVTTQPGSKSQQNAQRRGFDLLYTRAVLVKQP
jgi:ribosomal protein S18 acetylase RimI-like enzyme